MPERETKITWIKYVATVVVGAVIALLVCILKGLFKTTDQATILRILSDAFTVAGILLFGFGMLSLVAKEGVFDGISYSFRTMRKIRRNYVDDEKSPKSYYEYKEAAKKKRKIAWHLVIVGLGYIAVAIVFIILHAGIEA